MGLLAKAKRPFFFLLNVMSEPEFYLQIVDRDGVIAKFPGGGHLETQLIDDITHAVMSKGVGFFKTEAAVESALRDGMREVLRALKRKTIQLV
jgi:hypothetical protein